MMVSSSRRCRPCFLLLRWWLPGSPHVARHGSMSSGRFIQSDLRRRSTSVGRTTPGWNRDGDWSRGHTSPSPARQRPCLTSPSQGGSWRRARRRIVSSGCLPCEWRFARCCRTGLDHPAAIAVGHVLWFFERHGAGFQRSLVRRVDVVHVEVIGAQSVASRWQRA